MAAFYDYRARGECVIDRTSVVGAGLARECVIDRPRGGLLRLSPARECVIDRTSVVGAGLARECVIGRPRGGLPRDVRR